MDIASKVAVVTGGASDLGRAVAEALRQAGARVALFDRDAARGAAAAAAMCDAALFAEVDVNSESRVQAGIDRALAAFGSIHVCVNCADVPDAAKTVAAGKPFPLAVWDKVIAVDLTGTSNVLGLAAVAMTRSEPDDEERGVIGLTRPWRATSPSTASAVSPWHRGSSIRRWPPACTSTPAHA